jgi:hypothetical protein
MDKLLSMKLDGIPVALILKESGDLRRREDAVKLTGPKIFLIKKLKTFLDSAISNLIGPMGFSLSCRFFYFPLLIHAIFLKPPIPSIEEFRTSTKNGEGNHRWTQINTDVA